MSRHALHTDMSGTLSVPHSVCICVSVGVRRIVLENGWSG